MEKSQINPTLGEELYAIMGVRTGETVFSKDELPTWLSMSGSNPGNIHRSLTVVDS